MNATCLLLLEANRLTAWSDAPGGPRLIETFPATTEGQRRFGEFVANRGKFRFRLVANLTEESRVVETIPALRRKDRQALLARKLAREFPDTALACWESLGFASGPRKNEHILLAALGAPERLAPWLAPFENPDHRLASLHSLAQMAGPLLRKLGEPPDRRLLLTRHGHQLRESFVVDGLTCFTRLVHCPEHTPELLAASFAREAEKLRQYLVTQREVDAHRPLRVVLLAPLLPDETIAGAFAAHGLLDCRIATGNEAVSGLRLSSAARHEGSDGLFLALLARRPPSIQFAGPALRHGDRLALWRQALLGAGTAFLAACLLFSLARFETGHRAREQTSSIRTQAADAERRYREIAAGFPRTGLAPAVLRRLASSHDALAHAARLPTAAWQGLSSALSRHPAISLTRLEWEFGQNFRSTANEPRQPETTRLYGAVAADEGSRHEGKRRFEQFVASLQVESGRQVRVLQAPAGSPERGNDLHPEGTASATHLTFALEILQPASP